MHLLPASSSLRTYLLDLVYLSATLQAAQHSDLAAEVQTKIHELRAQRVRHERAEELEVVASATVAAEDLGLDAALLRCAAHMKAHHPELYEEFFAVSASKLAEKAYADELQAVRALDAHLETLPAADAVRAEFSPLLRSHADSLEHAIAQKKDLLAQFTVVRSEGDRARASVNALRTSVHARLVLLTHNKKSADVFFRPSPKNDSVENAPSPVPGAAGTPSSA